MHQPTREDLTPINNHMGRVRRYEAAIHAVWQKGGECVLNVQKGGDVLESGIPLDKKKTLEFLLDMLDAEWTALEARGVKRTAPDDYSVNRSLMSVLCETRRVTEEPLPDASLPDELRDDQPRREGPLKLDLD